jgi:hypothetical protein
MVSRRSALRLFSVGVGATAPSQLVFAQVRCPVGQVLEGGRCVPAACPAGQVLQNGQCVPAPGTCSVSFSGAQSAVQYSAQSIFNGKPLVANGSNTWQTRRATNAAGASVPPGLLASQMAITLDGAPLLGINFAAGATNSSFTVDMTYGDGYKGVHRVSYAIVNGYLTGGIDGRSFIPQHVGLPVRGQPPPGAPLAFRDGQPTPTDSAVDPQLAAAISQLLQNDLSQVIAGCGRFIPEGLSADTQACNNCTNNCGEQTVTCVAVATATCAADFGISCLAIPACYANEAICASNCNSPGQPCCQEQCPGGACCETGDACCGGNCCDPNTVCCGTTCCDPGQICSSDVCCPSDQPVGCAPGYQICCAQNETCCGPYAATVGPPQFNCCQQGESCLNQRTGLCCKNGDVSCGNVCCSSSSYCTNDGSCCAPGPGAYLCKDRNGVPQSCCANSESCNQQTGQCGYNPCGDTFCGFQECCNGVCCNFNQTCTEAVTITGLQQVCTGATCAPGTVPCEYTPNQCCPPNYVCCTDNTCCEPNQQCCGYPLGCQPVGGCGN